MKMIHRFKVGESHYIKIYKTNSPSNFTLFLTLYRNKDNMSIYGATLKTDSTKTDFMKVAEHGIKLYYHENNINSQGTL